MPRRALSSATPTRASSEAKFVAFQLPADDSYHANLRQLRTNWKWAAFSQFFCTFAPLLAMPDVSLVNVEDDLAGSTVIYIPRVMQRLLYTLTQDRKINIDNWQSSLRKQYLKRSPEANPLGPEPVILQEPEESDEEAEESAPQDQPTPGIDVQDWSPSEEAAVPNGINGHAKEDPSHLKAESTKKEASPEDVKEVQESKDWLDLSLLEKLDALHLVTEWQFQNPHRLRTFMKDDDESANWRIEPIGYDSRTNAYWFIGPDRLWIQRVPPKPPRTPKRKRRSAVSRKTNGIKASSSKKLIDEESEDEIPAERSKKRKRTQPSRGKLQSKSNSAKEPSVENGSGGRSRSRAAKVQANKKLDAQAKELAEFQRQNAASHAAAAKKQADRKKTGSPRKTVLGTRTSARLRGTTSGEDDEWQPIPAEWLEEASEEKSEKVGGRSTRSSARVKWKGKEPVRQEEVVEDEEEDQDEDRPSKADVNSDGDSSDLTELSDVESEAGSVDADPPDPQIKTKFTGRSSRRTNGKVVQSSVSEDETPIPSNEVDVSDTPALPADFIEWELICTTLYEWEHIAEHFENAAHYLEKALYKVLSKTIVPAVTTELKEAERKRKLEEAIVHRKRSSRIAIKESEKEEARALAKKKAEDEEKLARARRVEARTKKEEAERAKREQAREQRRLEREEREHRAQMKEERRQRSGAVDRDVSSGAPTMSAVPSPGTSHLAQSTPPSGTRTPDWILDCEICGKRGANIDDGLPMVSCGLCSRWQHIPCYDHADRIAGRPRRNWDYQQFYCHRCRSQGLGTAPPTAHQSSTDGLSNSSFYSQNSRTSYSQQSAYPQSMSHRQDLRVQPLDNGVFRAYQYSHANSAPQPSAYSRSQYPTTQSLYGQFQLDQSGYAAQSSQLSAGMSRRVDSAGEQSDPSSQSHQYGSSYVNSVDSNKGTTSQGQPYLAPTFSHPSVREAYMVSDTRHTVSRDASLSNQRTSMGSEEQGTYLPQASNLHSGTWRYSGQRDTSREGIELQAYRSPDRAVQFYRS